MTMDPVADLIIRIKNAGAVGKEFVTVPFSKFTLAISEKLKDVGYVKSVEQKGKKHQRTIEIALRYDKKGTHAIHDVRRVSKPGRRLYQSVREIVPVRYGTGSLIISTPKGVMTDAEARKERVGGEALFKIW